jgi:hypothetical protein
MSDFRKMHIKDLQGIVRTSAPQTANHQQAKAEIARRMKVAVAIFFATSVLGGLLWHYLVVLSR